MQHSFKTGAFYSLLYVLLPSQLNLKFQEISSTELPGLPVVSLVDDDGEDDEEDDDDDASRATCWKN